LKSANLISVVLYVNTLDSIRVITKDSEDLAREELAEDEHDEDEQDDVEQDEIRILYLPFLPSDRESASCRL
jgi:hypothetical protein